eukprot:TRINITY_DN42203_c0_g1_i1.p1 TRINITY_DN42203_c0_g1~~TRINITY_DN42203_c0_g1_i1.p1  ORF type:complete len:271 (+),score=34.03 TRINITY_DN42203_c0_g1_i1:60-872(+)
MAGGTCDIRYCSEDIRAGFVRKVFGILASQVFFSVVVACFIYRQRSWLHHSGYMMALPAVLGIVALCAEVHFANHARTYPTNYILLMLITLQQAAVVGLVSSVHTWQTALLAAMLTAVVFASLTVYAAVAKTGFRGFRPYVASASTAMGSMGMLLFVLSLNGVHVPWLFAIMDLCGVLLLMCHVVYDTQKIVGEWGGHKEQFEIDDYAFAALALYRDLVEMFLGILRSLQRFEGVRRHIARFARECDERGEDVPPFVRQALQMAKELGLL